MTCGVYEVWCGPCFYQGSSRNIEKRVQAHLRDLKNGKHYNPKFQAAYNKHGWSSFAVLIECAEHALIAWEQQYLNANFGTEGNLNLLAVAGYAGPHFGVGEANRNRVWSEDSKQKLRDARASWTPEEQAAHAAKLRARPRPGPPSPEDIERVRALGQRERTPEELDRLRNLRAGQPVSDETRAKLSAAKKGKPHSDEHRARIAEAARKRWANARGEV